MQHKYSYTRAGRRYFHMAMRKDPEKAVEQIHAVTGRILDTTLKEQ